MTWTERNLNRRCSDNGEMTGLRRMGEHEEEKHCTEWACRPPYPGCLESQGLVCRSVGCRHIDYCQGKHLMLVLLHQSGRWRSMEGEANAVVVCRQWLGLKKQMTEASYVRKPSEQNPTLLNILIQNKSNKYKQNRNRQRHITHSRKYYNQNKAAQNPLINKSKRSYKRKRYCQIKSRRKTQFCAEWKMYLRKAKSKRMEEK